MRSTLQDVARRAGVSPSAASAALRPGRSSNVRLAEATRQRVLEAAAALGYRTNPLARALRGEATRTIGVLWWLGSPSGREFMARRIARMLQVNDYSTYLADHFASAEQVAEALKDFAVRGIDGVVLESDDTIAASRDVQQAIQAFKAAVVVQPTETSLGTDNIVHDRYVAIREAVDHLVATGRRRPVYLVARHANLGKASTFLDQLRRHGLTPAPDAVLDVDERHADNFGQLAIEALDAREAGRANVGFDAVLATSDELAVGAIAWLRGRGLRVPDDVAVVGANDAHMAGFLDPPLASVDRREPELVSLIEEKLFRRLDAPDAPPTRTSLAMRFVWRPSAGGSAQHPGQP
ncbi:LacI family DNA-binding transcriptional regulator [Phycisphaerales bacterium AB-hyl4]|uniref:LacI family DNA-binding transcriptional regulator n=1 Tax=Natronomicrosphaera hydrolytica TaxID=3242702 RepID=A0ABV4U286_9BACT